MCVCVHVWHTCVCVCVCVCCTGGVFFGEVVSLDKPSQSLLTLGSHWQREVSECCWIGQVEGLWHTHTHTHNIVTFMTLYVDTCIHVYTFYV